MKYFYIFFCFLIISCDLPNEADKDCNGEAAGLATIDDCGVCSGGVTGIDYNYNMDSCGECFGDNSCLSEGLCNDPDAINYHEEAVIINNSLCIYDLCIEYYESNIDFSCESSNQSPYSIGDQLGCDILETEFDICFPNCSESIKLADFEDKIILIIYEEDWWTSCYGSIPQLEEDIIIPYIDHPDVAIINILSDGPGGYSCSVWGEAADNRIPILVNDYDHNNIFGSSFISSWGATLTWSSPWYLIIDQNYIYHSITNVESEAKQTLELLLTNME